MSTSCAGFDYKLYWPCVWNSEEDNKYQSTTGKMRETERQLMARLKREAEEAEAAAAAAGDGVPSPKPAAGTEDEAKPESDKKKGTPSASTKGKKATPAKKAAAGDKGKKGKGSAAAAAAPAKAAESKTLKKGGTNKKKASPPKKKASTPSASSKKASKSKRTPETEPSPPEEKELVDSDSEDSDGSYELSTCCECGQLEDRSADIPILLCDGCDNECHLTCARDRPKLTKVPEGDWYCSACVRKRKKATAAGGGGGSGKKKKKPTLEERKRLDAEKAAASKSQQESGSTLSNEELAGLVASSEKKDGATKKKKVAMDDFDMDSSSSSESDGEEDVKPWARKERKGTEAPVDKKPPVARKKTLEEVKQDLIEKKKKDKASTAEGSGSAGDVGAVKVETKPKISLIGSMAPPPSAAAPPSAVAASAVPLGRAAAGAAGRSQSFGQQQQQQQQQQKSWNVAPVKREPAPTHQPPRGSPRRSPVPPTSGPPASPHPPILNSPEKRAQSRSLLGKLECVIDTVTDAPIGGEGASASLAWTGSDQDRLRARNNGMDFNGSLCKTASDSYDFFDEDDFGRPITTTAKIPMFPEDFKSGQYRDRETGQVQTEWPLSWWGIVQPSKELLDEHRRGYPKLRRMLADREEAAKRIKTEAQLPLSAGSDAPPIAAGRHDHIPPHQRVPPCQGPGNYPPQRQGFADQRQHQQQHQHQQHQQHQQRRPEQPPYPPHQQQGHPYRGGPGGPPPSHLQAPFRGGPPGPGRGFGGGPGGGRGWAPGRGDARGGGGGPGPGRDGGRGRGGGGYGYR